MGYRQPLLNSLVPKRLQGQSLAALPPMRGAPKSNTYSRPITCADCGRVGLSYWEKEAELSFNSSLLGVAGCFYERARKKNPRLTEALRGLVRRCSRACSRRANGVLRRSLVQQVYAALADKAVH